MDFTFNNKICIFTYVSLNMKAKLTDLDWTRDDIYVVLPFIFTKEHN